MAVCIFFFKQKTGYGVRLSLVGSEECIRDRMPRVAKQKAIRAMPRMDRKARRVMPQRLEIVTTVPNTHLTLPTNREV